MKVFLSHSTKDREFVKRLAVALQDARFEPWLCEVDIDKAENFVAKIEEGLVQSDVALVVWSPDSAASGQNRNGHPCWRDKWLSKGFVWALFFYVTILYRSFYGPQITLMHARIRKPVFARASNG